MSQFLPLVKVGHLFPDVHGDLRISAYDVLYAHTYHMYDIYTYII